jgi:hypothetical protein
MHMENLIIFLQKLVKEIRRNGRRIFISYEGGGYGEFQGGNGQY